MFCGGVLTLSPTLSQLRHQSLAQALLRRELVVHSGQTDIELLAVAAAGEDAAADRDSLRVFDTQIAANFLGVGRRLGLGQLIQSVLDIDVRRFGRVNRKAPCCCPPALTTVWAQWLWRSCSTG